MGTVLVAFLGYIGGLASKAIFEVWRDNRSTPKIQTYGFYYDGFPKAIQILMAGELIPDEIWVNLPDDKRHLFNNLRCYVLFLQNAGTSTVRNLRIKAHAKDGSGIAFHHFNVEKLIVCDRLTTESDEDKSVTASWNYLNRGDFVEFYVVATATDERADITIDVDGEGIAIRETFLFNPISLLNPMKSASTELKNNKFLAKYLEQLIAVTSYGDDLPNDSTIQRCREHRPTNHDMRRRS